MIKSVNLQRILLLIALAAILAVTLVLLSGQEELDQPVYYAAGKEASLVAEGKEVPENSTDRASQPAPSTTRRAAGRLQPIRYSPANCIGYSRNPHKSTTIADTIKGLTEFECDYFVTSVRTRAQLWRNRWWGFEKVGKVGDNTNDPAKHVQASAKYGNCENNKWRTEGDHWSVEDGETYTAHTMKYKDVTNC